MKSRRETALPNGVTEHTSSWFNVGRVRGGVSFTSASVIIVLSSFEHGKDYLNRYFGFNSLLLRQYGLSEAKKIIALLKWFLKN